MCIPTVKAAHLSSGCFACDLATAAAVRAVSRGIASGIQLEAQFTSLRWLYTTATFLPSLPFSLSLSLCHTAEAHSEF